MRSTDPGPHSCVGFSCSRPPHQLTSHPERSGALKRAWPAWSNHCAQALPKCQGQCDSSNSCHDEGLQGPRCKLQRLPCHPGQSYGRLSQGCALMGHWSRLPMEGKSPLLPWRSALAVQQVLTYAMLSGIFNSLIWVGVSLNDMLINPLLRHTHKSPESLLLCSFKVGHHPYQVCMWMLPCLSPTPMLLEHVVTATGAWDLLAHQPHTFPKHLAGFLPPSGSNTPWCAHCLQDPWMPSAHQIAEELQNPYSSVWLRMSPSTHDHKLSSCNPRPTLPIRVHHSEHPPLEACCIPDRPPEGERHIPNMGCISGFNHGLNGVAQDVDHDTGTHLGPWFNPTSQSCWNWVITATESSVLKSNSNRSYFNRSSVFCQIYHGCSRLTDSPTQGFPALSLITWHLVHMSSTQQTKRSAGALGWSPLVSDCMIACCGVLGVCWILWGLSDSSTIPACLAHDVCVGS